MSAAETIILKEVRQRHEQAPTNWIATHKGDECTLQAHPPNSMGKTVIHEDYATMRSADMEAIALLNYAHHDIGFLLGLIKRASETIKALRASNTPPTTNQDDKDTAKNYTANCAILCKEPKFKAFLKKQHGLGNATDDATVAKVKELLGIASRKTLNENPKKAQIWLKLVREYEDWKRHEQHASQ